MIETGMPLRYSRIGVPRVDLAAAQHLRLLQVLQLADGAPAQDH
jgi:hypothetical protein